MNPEDVLDEIDEDDLRQNFNIYTVQAFQTLPILDKPKILDIGCGSGIPTLELARLSGGEVIGLDIDEVKIKNLDKKIEKAEMTDQVKTMIGSMLDIKFPDESFDVLWAEGVMKFIGFERGLNEWHRLLKPEGFLVIHDDKKDVETNLELITNCGYRLIDHFSLPDDSWWAEYYGPLETMICELSEKYHDQPETLKVLDKKRREIDDVKCNPKDYRSIFFIMQMK